MSNFLDYRCPRCAATDEIDVAATVWLRLTAHGTDADQAAAGDHTYERHSPATCEACGYIGTLGDFEPVVAAVPS